MWLAADDRSPAAATVDGMPMAKMKADRAVGVDVADVLPALRNLRDEVRRAASEGRPGGDDPSVANMRAYLALRQHDHRDLQAALALLGLSSLGRSEAHVLATVEQVLAVAECLASGTSTASASFDESAARLRRRTQALFGDARSRRETRIMVTLPSEAAADGDLIREFVGAGMDCVRINSAHDDATAWTAMAAGVRTSARAAGRRVPILVDLPGPKLRTGSIEPGPDVIHLRPHHDELGGVVAPALAWLAADESRIVPREASVVLPVERGWLEALAPGDQIVFTDARGRHRQLRVGSGSSDGRWAEISRGAYLVSGTTLKAKSAGETRLGQLPSRPAFIKLAAGDTLKLTRDLKPGRPATTLSPARIPCTLAQAFGAVAVGDSVWLDDGKFGGVARRVTARTIEVEITHAPPGGGRLRAEKGINFPDTRLPVTASREIDEPTIAFAAAHADMIGLSFVSTRADVRVASDALARNGGDHLGLILKIETRAGFEALPSLLTEALGRDAPCGVMIARGDLAIEVGWERLAEVQEEILWLCEAAHVPVIWATQVLDTLARTGTASRAEITDAASGARAECVMLNKGPMVVSAIATLDDILHRMASHRHKKTSLLRHLHAWSAE
jgi:pyruvate kinase